MVQKKTYHGLLDSIVAALYKISALNPTAEELDEATSIEELSVIDEDLWSLHDYLEEQRNEGYQSTD